MTNVVVVLDPAFGERLESLLPVAPIWIVSSKINEDTYQRLRGHEHEDHKKKGAITNFDVSDANDRVRGLLDIVPVLETHHGHVEGNEMVFPNGFVLEVIGIPLTKTVIEGLERYGFTSFNEISQGFKASK